MKKKLEVQLWMNIDGEWNWELDDVESKKTYMKRGNAVNAFHRFVKKIKTTQEYEII